MTEQETFITRLRRHRERNRIPLQAISRDTRVKLELLEGLEKNDLSAWPRGLYARAYIRAYAAAIGLDGGDAVDEFCRLFPQGDRRTDSVIREIAAIVASPSEYRDEYQREMNRRRSPQPEAPAPAATGFVAAMRRAGSAALALLGSRSERPTTRSATR
jgi:hypothetical protein